MNSSVTPSVKFHLYNAQSKQKIVPKSAHPSLPDTEVLPTEIQGEIDQLDESVFKKLTRQNSRHGLSQTTIHTYQAAVRDFNRFLLENNQKVNEASLRRYFEIQKQILKPSTLNLRKYAIKKCIRAQFGADNPLAIIAIENVFAKVTSYKLDKAKSPKECLTEYQVRLLADAAPVKTRLIIKFLFTTGCRVSEMIGIRRSDCEPINGYVKIMLLGKGNQQRYVAIPLELFSEVIDVFCGKTWLFSSRSGKQLNRHNVKMQIMRIGKKLGLHVTPHALRHARASDLLLNKGFSLKSVSRHIGHSSPAITAEMYIHDSIDFTEMFARDQI